MRRFRGRCQLLAALWFSALLSSGCETEQQKQERFEQQQWDTARQQNTVESYRAFLAAFSTGRHADEARSTQANLAWERIKAKPTRAGYLDFTRDFPDSPYLHEARARSQDFSVKLVGMGEVETVRADAMATGPILEVASQWGERTFRLDRDSVFATNTTGGKVELECLVPASPDAYKLKVLPYPDQIKKDGTYTQTTIVPGRNTFTNKNVYVFCSKDDDETGKVFFELTTNDAARPARVGLVYERNAAELKDVHVLGTTIPMPAR